MEYQRDDYRAHENRKPSTKKARRRFCYLRTISHIITPDMKAAPTTKTQDGKGLGEEVEEVEEADNGSKMLEPVAESFPLITFEPPAPEEPPVNCALIDGSMVAPTF